MVRWWLIAAIAFWLRSSYTAAVGNKLSTIGNIVSLARSVTLILLFKTLFKFFCAFDLYCIIYDWISIMGYSKRGLSAINTLYSIKESPLVFFFFREFFSRAVLSERLEQAKAEIAETEKSAEKYLNYSESWKVNRKS